jgi:recombination protein RecT
MNEMTRPGRELAPVERLRGQLQAMTGEFKSALPSHIAPEKFQRVVMTVVQQQPELLEADRRSLLASCTKCAADGLIPDGREAALVIFRTKDGPKVQYMPMLAGVLKRMRNSGEIAAINVQVVHENDDFTWSPDDFDRPVKHSVPAFGTDRGKVVGAYAVAKLRDGSLMAEVMDRQAIERVRQASRAKDSGPWVQWWDQMARKTVLRRLAKYLPMDAETANVVRNDDEADAPASVETTATEAPPAPALPPASKLDAMEAQWTDDTGSSSLEASPSPAAGGAAEDDVAAVAVVEAPPADPPAPIAGAGTIVELLEEAAVPEAWRPRVVDLLRDIVDAPDAAAVFKITDTARYQNTLKALDNYPKVKTALVEAVKRGTEDRA